jgi:pyruvate dehydrogenase complex dehydrogenase (E1) component
MRVSKELIEKYHNGLCTPDEMTLVENWLLDDEADDISPLPKTLEKEIAQVEMWEEISSVLPSSQKRFSIGGIYLSKAKWTTLAAAGQCPRGFNGLTAGFQTKYTGSSHYLG